MRVVYLFSKRALDICLGGIAALLLSPLLFPVAIILRLTGEHYVFYKQERVGLNGKPFGLLKFASMLVNSPNLSTGDITVKNDPRVLPIGGVLRKTKINELPQLINVLKGDMGIIGPRPLTPKNFDYYPTAIKDTIAKMRPGLSGVGSIVFRDEESLMVGAGVPHHEFYKEHISPYKGELEVWYYNNRSFFLDLQLILFTAIAVANPRFDIHQFLPGLPERPEALRGH